MQHFFKLRTVAVIAGVLVLLSILAGLTSPKKEFAKIDLCRDLATSSRLLGWNASSFYGREGRWPDSKELGQQLAASNSHWSSFSGGESNWIFEVDSDKRFRITFVGKGRDKCEKVFFIDLPKQSGN